MRNLPHLRSSLAGFAAAACLVFSGCSAGKPALPRDLAAAESLPVKKKLFILFSGERLSFGDWRVHKVKRDTSHTIERPKHSRISVALRETYTFRMSGGGSGEWRAECRNQGSREDEVPFLGPLRERGYQVTLQCDLREAEAPHAWRLDLAEADSDGRVMKGVLTDGNGGELKVEGSRSLGRRSREEGHTFFEFSHGGAVVGGVVVAQGDRVLIHPSANGHRAALAAAAAALLLYMDSNERMKSIVEARLQADRMMFL